MPLEQVYFVQDTASSQIKIGRSTNLGARLAALHTAHARPLDLLGVIVGGRAEETALHSRFAAHRVAREWFRPAPELLAFIAEHAERIEIKPAATQDAARERGNRIVVSVRISQPALAALDALAAAAGVTRSEWVEREALARRAVIDGVAALSRP